MVIIFILKIIRRNQVEHILSDSIPEGPGLHVLPPANRNCFFI